MKSSKSLKEYRTSSSTTCNGAIMKKDANYGYNIKTKYVTISATTTIFPTTTTTRTATKHMLAHRYVEQAPYRPYRILIIDISIELAQQHASCVDMTIPASQNKSRASTLPTYNVNTSDPYTHNTHPRSTPS